MSSLRFGSFKPNILGAALFGFFFLFFVVYMAGYYNFNKAYHVLYDEDEYKSIQNMKWFLIGCPVTMLISAFILFIVSSFDSRQILLGVRFYIPFFSFHSLLKVIYCLRTHDSRKLTFFKTCFEIVPISQFSALLFLGGVGLMLIAAWLGTNITRFTHEKGWETCTPHKYVSFDF
jgi:magnesium-transporting ATPase (P-type)